MLFLFIKMALSEDNQNKKTSGLSYDSDAGYPWEKNEKAEMTKGPNERMISTDQAYGHDLNWYLKIFGWPVFAFVVLTILLEYLFRRYFLLLPEASSDWIFFLLRSLMYLTISVTAFFKYKSSLAQAMVSCLSGAFIAGIIISIFQLFWYSSWWTFINLISLPLLMVFEGLIYLVVIYGIYNLLKK